ncbi:phytoene desaturase family protein [Rhodococcus sp. MEB064]|uniref:phytoene desaturase family protein n=1 Tax=Rhodococcus sp. MEB064 TaxID=1587522 RepID=UPI0009E442E5|nr:phytoene desaturase family protein [Rhodococcus sp. MEB064]
MTASPDSEAAGTRVVVVGAGIGGLATAARLSYRGFDVTVLEQSDQLGGKLGLEEHDGFLFDTGPSLVTMPYVFDDLFEQTGGPADLTFERLPVACRYRFPDGTVLDMPGRAEEIPAALDAALGGDAGAQWSRFSARAEQIWDATHEAFLESPIGPRELATLSRRVGDLRTIAPWSSLRSLGRQYLTDPRLRMMLDRYATYTGSDPRRAPAALATVPHVEQRWGSWHVPGGLHRIADAVAERASSLGADIRTGVTVTSVVVEDGRVRGVETTDGRIAADIVVANADAEQVYRSLVPRAPRTAVARRRLAATTPSLSGFVVLLALRGRDADTPHHRVLFPNDYDAEFDAVFGTRARPAHPAPSPTVYVSAPDDPALRPDDDSEAWFVLVNAARHGTGSRSLVDWDEPGLRERYASRILDVMAERGVDVRDRVLRQTVISPADLMRRTMTPGGSIYGTSSNGVGAAFLRPANRSPVPGLYLVGGSSHPGGGLPLVTLSAQIVDQLIGQ